MCRNESVLGCENVEESTTMCDVCSLAKGTKLPHNKTRPCALQFLENVHVDLSGIMRTKGLNNESYYILFTNDYSSYRHMYLLTDKTKEEVFDIFQAYIAMTEHQTGHKLKQFTLDRGGEFVNSLLGTYLKDLGIILHLTAGLTPEQNGVAERSNRTISTKARCMLIESCMPIRFWYQACNSAVFLMNRTVTVLLSGNRTPFEVWNFRKPSVDHLRIFGCQVYQLIRKEIRNSKYSPVTSEGVLVGYNQDNFNYQIFDLAEKKIFMSHDVKFNETTFPFSKQVSQSQSSSDRVQMTYFDEDEDESTDLTNENTTHTSQNIPNHELAGLVDELTTRTDSEPPGPTHREEQINPHVENSPLIGQQGSERNTSDTRRSSRQRNTVSYKGMCSMAELMDDSPMFDCLPEAYSIGNPTSTAPKLFKKAMESSDGDQWRIACNKEMRSLGSIKRRVDTCEQTEELSGHTRSVVVQN